MESWKLLINSATGIYMPQLFAQMAKGEQITPEQKGILLHGPEHDDYWEVWEEVVNTCKIVGEDDGIAYTLHVEEDLWAVPEDFNWEEFQQ